jgi:hypothetical protein
MCNCQKKPKISGVMTNAKMSKSLNTVLGTTGGIVAGGMLNKVSFIQQNPTIGGAVKLVAGIMLAGSGKRGGLMQSVGMGMSAVGAMDVLSAVAPGTFPTISGIGAGGSAYGSTSLHSVARTPLTAGQRIIID